MSPFALLISTVTFTALARGAEPASGSAFYHTSWPEASAIVAIGDPARWMVVADNEIPRLAVYPIEPQAVKLHAPALTVATSPNYAVDDLEGLTVFPWDPNGDGKPEQRIVVAVGSCSRTKKGKAVPERDALFGVNVDTAALEAGRSGAFPEVAAAGINRSLRAQIRALGSEHARTSWGPVLRDSVAAAGRDPEAPDFSLAGGSAAGLNIEGLSVSGDGRALLLGLRAPVANGRAMVIPVSNPVAALGLGGSAPQPVALADPFLLNLGGLGIRSIEWDAGRKAYLIIAGSPDEAKTFRFFTWSGQPGAEPVPVTSASAVEAAKIDPEGVTPVAGWKAAAVVGDGTAGAPYHKGMWVDFGPAKAR